MIKQSSANENSSKLPSTDPKHECGMFCDGQDGYNSECAKAKRETQTSAVRKHSHYFKDVSTLDTIDVYRVLKLFNVTDPCLQHAVKKLLVAGGRGAGKDISQDVQEAIDTLERWKAMRAEDMLIPTSVDPRAK